MEADIIVSAEQKYLATTALRRKIMDKQYSWWHWCKYVAWIFTIGWTITCAIITLIFVIRFDMLRQANNNVANPYSTSVCTTDHIDIHDESLTSYTNSQRAMTNYLNNADSSTLNSKNGFALKESVTRWLLSIFIGFLLSLFVWQPLFDLILQIIKVLRFDPEDVTESYFFANTKLLLSQAERQELIGNVANMDLDLDDNADDESQKDDDDHNEHVEPKNDVPSDDIPSNVTSPVALQAHVELMNTNPPNKQ